MKNRYLFLQIVVSVCALFPRISNGQCALLSASFTSYESRCAATGAIRINATGGSGNYKYKTTGPVNTNFTTSDSITGLSAGIYSLIVNDVVTNCTLTIPNVQIAGSYQDPRFTLVKSDVSCEHGSNGIISVDGFNFGRAPFIYTIVTPSPAGIGTSNSAGVFSGLLAGTYSIRMTDSCGGIQTRQITLLDYSWWIDAYSFTKTGCDAAAGYIKVVDSRGNISTSGGIPGFTYGIVRAAGDTIWSANPNFSFSLLGNNSFDVIARDNCGVIKKAGVRLSLAPAAATNVNTFGYLCNSFSASLSVSVNFLSPDFCLFNSRDSLLGCNTTGLFTALPYGSYCIKVHDACTDTTITRCFSRNSVPVSIANQVFIRDKVCTSFTAVITGQTNLTNPQYCLYDATNTLVVCNTTGVFPGLTYQSYCITTTDGCRDTTITRCFETSPPVPVVPPVIVPLYVTCTNFGVHIGGDSLTNPVYCLYDSTGVLITCNNTGIFDSIPLGNYCINIHDDCYDTIITRCISVLVPIIQNDVRLSVSNKGCSGFTLTVSSQIPGVTEYCVYTTSDSLIACNANGIFNNIPYGDYCVKTRIECPDTILVNCINVQPNLPSIGTTVKISNLTCTGFSAEIQQIQNMVNPTFCIYNEQNILVNCNSTGLFNNLAYGTYCIKVADDCYDTTITRCFTQLPVKVSLSGSSGKSCSYGWAQFSFNLGGGTGYYPVNISVYNPVGTLISQASYQVNQVMIDSIPALASGQYYMIIARDICGNSDTIFLGSVASYLNHSVTVLPKCPSANWANGSGNITASVNTNLGSVSVKIIKKNGINYFPSLTANSILSGVYTFIDLGPGTYILSYSENWCNKKIYDTVLIGNYQYPNLDRSSAYQCDVNGFSVSAVATNGVGPYSYQIIGSQPVSPSINSAPQSSPVFTINNGANYSLVRLRALDACGNATLGDASILPLAINASISSTDCIFQPTTLSVDSIYNSTYTWYKKLLLNSTDSTLIGTGTSHFIPAVLPSDTGIYLCYVSVNSGCIKRTFTFHLGGNCWIILPITLEEFKGRVMPAKNLLTWITSLENGLTEYVIERRNARGIFTSIGHVIASPGASPKKHYSFADEAPIAGDNVYRLRMQNNDRSFSFSNLLLLKNTGTAELPIVFPNPVINKFMVKFYMANEHRFTIKLANILNQVVLQTEYTNTGEGLLEVQRPGNLKKGVYLLDIFDQNLNQSFKYKLIFL